MKKDVESKRRWRVIGKDGDGQMRKLAARAVATRVNLW